MTHSKAATARGILSLVGVLVLCTTPCEAATRKECKPARCRTEIDVCKASCTSGSKREQRRCRRKCKSQVTQACRADQQRCGDGGSGGECKAYTSADACPARSLEPFRERNPICVGDSGAGHPCDADFDTKFRVRTPWRTHEGECCVIDTCRGATAFGIYDNLAFPPFIPPGSSLTTAPVIVTVQSLSSYFQKPPTGTGIRGQWSHTTATILGLTCSTPPNARVISVAGGPLSAVTRVDYLSYDTRPVPAPTGSWDFPTLSDDATTVSFAPPHPPLLPYCGSAPDTLTCQPRVFNLDNVNFTGDTNPIVEVLSERIGIDRLCDATIFVSAEGTFRRRDGSECSVQIFGKATLPCATRDDCMAGEVCTTTDPTSPTDFGNAFPGWAGQSCVIPTP